jgi:NAD(P)-dependent dehydrogenase (short-subunit alcohol dehydrogenase family)
MAKQPTVLITGAAGGVGRATVELFIKEGWRVLAVDVKQKPDQALPKGALLVHADLSVAHEVEALADSLSSEIPDGLHALVNNAALQIIKSLVETTPEDWDRVHAVNLRAPYLMARAFHGALKKAQGAIVNVSSVHALATSEQIGAYASAKGGLLALTRSMAIEFAEDGIRANAVLPGATDTPMLAAGLDRGRPKGGKIEARKEGLANKILLKRLAAPEEIARVIYFLADSRQSSYITGQSLVADGGVLARLSSE